MVLDQVYDSAKTESEEEEEEEELDYPVEELLVVAERGQDVCITEPIARILYDGHLDLRNMWDKWSSIKENQLYWEDHTEEGFRVDGLDGDINQGVKTDVYRDVDEHDRALYPFFHFFHVALSFTKRG